MDVTLAVLADHANVSDQGKLNILGIFDRIMANNFPAIHPQMHLVLRFSASPAERGYTKAVEIQLLDSDGGEVVKVGGTMEVPREPKTLTPNWHQIITINMLKFPKPGEYAFHILINEELKAVARLLVEQIPGSNGEE